MTNDESQSFRLQRPAARLPVEGDFDPFGGNLDAQCAWKHFGELTLNQTYELFLTNPINYQEDFMFMGSAAFSYYFPVVDRYIRGVTGAEDGNDCEVAILGSGIAAQFDWKGASLHGALIAGVEQLSDYVG